MNEDVFLKIAKKNYPGKQFLSYTYIRVIKILACERRNPHIRRSALLFMSV